MILVLVMASVNLPFAMLKSTGDNKHDIDVEKKSQCIKRFC